MPWGDGKETLILGLKGKGKTTVAIQKYIEPSEYAVAIVPGITNPGIRAMNYLPGGDTDDNLKELQYYIETEKKFRVDFIEENLKLFDYLSQLHGGEDYLLPVLLDDVSAILTEPELKAGFKRFIRKVRWRNIHLILTTHRISDDIPKVGGILADEVMQVGAQDDETEIDLLYKRARNVSMSYEDFDAKIRNLPDYDWKTRNFEEAVFVTKS